MVIRKIIKPELFHKGVMLLNGRIVQIDKVIEEMLELKEALDEKDREHIVEELADVEVTLPYLILTYMSGDKFEVKRTGSYDYAVACDLLIICINLYRANTGNINLYNAMKGLTRHLCECLYNIYQQYEISFEEVDQWKIKKKARTLARKAQEII